MAKRNENSNAASIDPDDDCWEDVPEDTCTPPPLDSTVDTMRSLGVWGLYSRVRSFADCVVCTDLVGQLNNGFAGRDCAVYDRLAKVAMDAAIASRASNAAQEVQDAKEKASSNAREQARACNALLPKFIGNRDKYISDYQTMQTEGVVNNRATAFCKQMRCCDQIA